MDIIKQYVDEFNKHDEEIYVNDISNNDSYEWLKEEIPHFRCSDKVIEKTYYFRWWTYRKHIKSTPDGYVITEFLPKVSWSQRYNTINAAAGHHISEGKWLKNGQKYLDDYIRLYLDNTLNPYQYSTWMLHSANELWQHTGKYPLSEDFLLKCCRYFETWEESHKTDCGLYWSYDNFDAMEFSISGTKNCKYTKGIRPTLNSYMYGEAVAISKFASLYSDDNLSRQYKLKSENIRELINKYLFTDGFYMAIHPENEDFTNIDVSVGCNARELIGYIPWWFGIADDSSGAAFDWLTDKNVFYTDYGLTTAEKNHSMFLYKYDAECLWNGYIWPFATTQSLNALKNYIFSYSNSPRYKDMYMKLLHQFAKSHQICRDGNSLMWIDECRHPLRDEWATREILKNKGWQENNGGYERGKDYNHSAFCDLLLSYILNIDYEKDEPAFNVNIPKDWDYFSIDNLYVRGKQYSVSYSQKNGLSIIKTDNL